MGRADGTAAEDDLPAADLTDLAPLLQLHPGCAPAGEEHAADQAVPLDLQVGPPPRRLQVANGGAPANAVGIVEGKVADPGGGGLVVVGAVGIAGGAGGVVEGALLG